MNCPLMTSEPPELIITGMLIGPFYHDECWPFAKCSSSTFGSLGGSVFINWVRLMIREKGVVAAVGASCSIVSTVKPDKAEEVLTSTGC